MTGGLFVARMILIGSHDRNCGKTALAKRLISRYARDCRVSALKVTTMSGDGGCPHGEDGCGVCASFDGGWCLERETASVGDKDTAQLLSAGARDVYWLRADAARLANGFREFLRVSDPDALIVAESNSLRNVVTPGVFIMLGQSETGKPTAAAVSPLADIGAQTGDDVDLSAIQIARRGGELVAGCV
jgi:hypothetical protein